MVNQNQKGKFLSGDVTVLKNFCDMLESAKKLIYALSESSIENEENFSIGYKKIEKIYKFTFQKNDLKDFKQLDDGITMDIKNICIKACNEFRS